MLLLFLWCWSGEVDDREAATGNPRGVDEDNAYRLEGIAAGLFSFRADQESIRGSTRNQKGNYFLGLHLHGKKPHRAAVKGLRQMNEQSTISSVWL